MFFGFDTIDALYLERVAKESLLLFLHNIMESSNPKGSTITKAEDESWRAVLPLSRVKKIIRTPQLLGMGQGGEDEEEELRNVSNEAVFLMAKATEHFIESLVKIAAQETQRAGRKVVKYDDLAAAVRKDEALEFLADIIPPRTAAGPALEKAKEKKPVPTEGDKDQNPEHVDRQTKLRFQPAKKARKE